MSGLTQLISEGTRGKAARIASAAAAFAARLRGDKRGNILTIFAIALPLMIGGLGLGVEGANWYQMKRSLQNAADQAVIAAATNNTSTYQNEARAVTAKYGFTNGTANVTVAASNAATCPDGTTTCYSVTITKKLPLIFSPVFGFAGNTTIGAAAAQLISATAVASYQTSPRNYCVLALASSVATDAIAFLANGGPKADLSGCSIMSNASMTCNGHDLQADYGDAHGTNNGCGNVQTSSMPQVTDPYAARASNIPANSCSSYPQQSGTLPSSNLWSGNKTFGTQTFCGDVKLTGNTTLLGDNVIVIRNGQLNLNGFTLSTGTNADGTAASAVIIFSGDNGSYTHTLTGNGNVNINSPTTGDWAGVALYTDPSLTTGVDMSAAGNSPSWNISGLAYFPHAAITWSGIVGKATSGHQCFVLVIDTIRFNGTAAMLDRGECDQQGLVMPNSQIPTRGRLVA